MNITGILNDLQARKIEVAINLFPQSAMSRGINWWVKLNYTSPAGDKLEVTRRNTDFEAALFAAYDALGLIQREGMNTMLPSPERGFSDNPPNKLDDEIPF